jgi:hypothetical protein
MRTKVGWALAGEARYRESAIAAASRLAGQFDEAGKFSPGRGVFGATQPGRSASIHNSTNLHRLAQAAADA